MFANRINRGAGMHVVIVCLANQCRSPIGEFLLARKLKESGTRDVEVTSAGLEATPGLPATSGARRAVQRKFGKDELRGHRATLLTPALIANADLVLVMTRGQRDFLRHEWAGVVDGVKGKVQTLGEFAGRPEVDVDDPVGGDEARYDTCLRLLEELTAAAAARLR
jgi:protein-tyrosine-phosphatase